MNTIEYSNFQFNKKFGLEFSTEEPNHENIGFHNENIECDVCGVPMTLKQKLKVKKNKIIRRYECDICNHKQTIFDVQKDVVLVSIIARNDAQEMYKEQEDNNN